ncbi:MAG: hypothetical protein JW850_01205 [Thermoflexales bacterium]|nr:hypothetical protein [Thermoflexales bacterium]
MKFNFVLPWRRPRQRKSEPSTWAERLPIAIDHALEAGQVVFEPLGEGLYVYAFPTVYDFGRDRERFNREARQAAGQFFGPPGPGLHTLIQFQEIRDGNEPYSLDYTAWAGEYARLIAEQEVGLYFMIRAQEFFPIVEEECQRVGVMCEKRPAWDVHLLKQPYQALFPTGDVVYEAVGRGTPFRLAVRDKIEALLARFPRFETFHKAVLEALPDCQVELVEHELLVSGPGGRQVRLNYWRLPREIGVSGRSFDEHMRQVREQLE